MTAIEEELKVMLLTIHWAMTEKKNIKKFNWLDYPYNRPYILLSKARLVDECISKYCGEKNFCNNYDNESLIHHLATYLMENQRSAITRGFLGLHIIIKMNLPILLHAMVDCKRKEIQQDGACLRASRCTEAVGALQEGFSSVCNWPNLLYRYGRKAKDDVC